MMSLVRSLPLLAVALTLASTSTSTADAAVETFSHSTSSASVPFTDNFTLPAFNTSLGTLTGVTISVSTSIVAEVDVTNATTTSQNFTMATAAVPVTITGPDATVITQTVTAGPVSGTVAAARVFNIPGVGNVTVPTVNTYPGLMSNSSITTTDPNLAAYLAGSAIPLSFSAVFGTGQYGGSANPGVSFGGSATASGSTTITYTYTATTIPEPASLGMIALGLSGALAVRRFRRRAA